MARSAMAALPPSERTLRQLKVVPAVQGDAVPTTLSRLEVDIVRVLSELAHPAGVREVSDALGRHGDLARLGVLSGLNGLVHKGAVSRPAGPGAYRYCLLTRLAPRMRPNRRLHSGRAS